MLIKNIKYIKDQLKLLNYIILMTSIQSMLDRSKKQDKEILIQNTLDYKRFLASINIIISNNFINVKKIITRYLIFSITINLFSLLISY